MSNNKTKQDVKVNLIQSYSIQVEPSIPIVDVINSDKFQYQLEAHVPLNRQISDTPTLVPTNLCENDNTDQLKEINYTMKQSEKQLNSSHVNVGLELLGIGFELKKGSDDFKTQLGSIVKNAFSEEIKAVEGKLTSELTSIKEQLNSVLNQSHNPKIIRQMIKELKIRAINNEFAGSPGFIELNANNSTYNDNSRLFESKYIDYCNQMFNKYQNTSTNTSYLNALFTYPMTKYNQLIHEDLSSYTIPMVQNAIEMSIDSSISDVPNHRLVKFFKKWRESRDVAASPAAGDSQFN